jgi:C-terminal domain on Strawberry notch homologue
MSAHLVHAQQNKIAACIISGCALWIETDWECCLQLIQELGGQHAVAEMTGRKGRIVADASGRCVTSCFQLGY